MVKIYHNPRCQKSREGLAFLEASGEEFEIIKYLENTISENELTTIISKLGIKPLDLLRKNEAVWKRNFKGKELTESAIILAMTHHPKLIERPIVVKGNKAVIGRPSEKISELLN
jgi:arsenate reductase